MARARVLHLITHLGVGGALDNTLLTVRHLSRERYEVHLAAGRLTAEDDYSDWATRGRECSDALFILPDLVRPVNYSRDLRALKRITEFIRSGQYQIVHTHCAKAGFLGRIAARRAGVPIIVHTYHAFPWQVAHGFERSPWRRGKSAVKKWLYIRMERHVAALSDALISVAELNRREAVELKLGPPDKFCTIHSGVDLGRFQVRWDRGAVRRSLSLGETCPVVGFIGRLSIQKAPLDFVEAAKIVLRRMPDTRFLVAGEGPQAGDVEKAAGDEPRIQRVGFRDDVPEILSTLDVLALSSLWEGLGRSLTEAMVMSVPVAATAVDGVPELVTHGQTGLLSPPRDPAKLAENILWLLEHRAEARAMGQRARERVLPLFGVERMVERIEALYERLLNSKGWPLPADGSSVGRVSTP